MVTDTFYLDFDSYDFGIYVAGWHCATDIWKSNHGAFGKYQF